MLRRTLISGLSALLILGAACSDDEPDVSRAELLAQIEGRSLSGAEIEEREAVARALVMPDRDT